MTDHKVYSIKLHERYGVDFPVCSNPQCLCYWDTTPSSDPHSHRCLMCGVDQKMISTMIKEAS